MSLIQQICHTNSREEVRNILNSQSFELRHELIHNAIEILNLEIESDIKASELDSAMLKMSRVVMLEDELHIVERIILKQGVLS